MKNEVEIYWQDLREETQHRLLELWGDNGNYDVFPLAVLSTESEETMEPEKQIRVLKVEPGCPPYEKVIDNDLKSIQAEVQGHFECVYLPNHVILCCNDEGKLNGMPPNRTVEEDIICGSFFLVAEDGAGNFVSLSNEQLAENVERFSVVEEFLGNEPELKPHLSFYSF